MTAYAKRALRDIEKDFIIVGFKTGTHCAILHRYGGYSTRKKTNHNPFAHQSFLTYEDALKAITTEQFRTKQARSMLPVTVLRK